MSRLLMPGKVWLPRTLRERLAHLFSADFERYAVLQSPSKIQRLLEIFTQATLVFIPFINITLGIG